MSDLHEVIDNNNLTLEHSIETTRPQQSFFIHFAARNQEGEVIVKAKYPIFTDNIRYYTEQAKERFAEAIINATRSNSYQTINNNYNI